MKKPLQVLTFDKENTMNTLKSAIRNQREKNQIKHHLNSLSKNVVRPLLLLTQLVFLGPSLALAAPYFSAGVVGSAGGPNQGPDASCWTSQGYSTSPLGVGMSSADGHALATNTRLPGCFGGDSAISVSSADLASGKLHAYSKSTFNSYAMAGAYFSDNLDLYFGGQLVSALPNGLFGEIRLDIHGSRSSAQDTYVHGYLDMTGLNGATLGYVSNSNLQDGDSFVLPFNSPFHFQAALYADAANGAVANFGNTATISVSLPEGYTFGSNSGVLLTAPVPVPAAMWLFGSGLLGLVSVARRKSRIA